MPYKVKAKCPHCKKTANGKDELEKLFGWRKVKGKTIPQSYCRVCRNKYPSLKNK